MKEPIWNKPRTLKELAAYYAVDKRTLKKWLSCATLGSIKPETGRFFSIRQVKVIVAHLGDQEDAFDPHETATQNNAK